MHLGKTKVMCNKHVNKDDVIVNEKKIEEVDRNIYLGQMVTKDHDQVPAVKRRMEQGWSAFSKLDNIIRNKSVPIRLKRKAFNECIFSIPLIQLSVSVYKSAHSLQWEYGAPGSVSSPLTHDLQWVVNS